MSYAGWEVRRLCSGGGGSVLRNTEGGGLSGRGGGRGCQRRAERCGDYDVAAAAAYWEARRAVGCGVGEADVGVGGELGGAATTTRQRRQRIWAVG